MLIFESIENGVLFLAVVSTDLTHQGWLKLTCGVKMIHINISAVSRYRVKWKWHKCMLKVWKMSLITIKFC